MSEIRYIISDLDGTLVDTFEANYLAYHQVFSEFGYELSKNDYEGGFGLRIQEFIKKLGIKLSDSNLNKLKQRKAECYPDYFYTLRRNEALYQYYTAFQRQGGHLAVVSTASIANIKNVLSAIDAEYLFDFIVSGEDVCKSKPNPECFECALKRWQASSDTVMIYEDSEIGMEAAKRAGIPAIRIGKAFYGD